MAEETYIISNNEFKIDDIKSYLVNIKNILIKMNIKLDSQEINKFLADSLNNSLFENDYNKDTAYEFINQKWNSIKLEPIETQIREFNKDEDYKYYVNLEDVIFLVFYKQIKYTKQIINEVNQYLNFGVNPIYIYAFIIQSFYDDPIVFNSYVYLIGKIKETMNDKIINAFLDNPIVEKLEMILKIIYTYDSEFNELMRKILSDRINFIKDGIIVTTQSYPTNYNCRETQEEGLITTRISENSELEKSEHQKNKDIEVLESHFYKLKCEMLFKKRKLELSDKLYTELNNLLSSEPIINLELWLGFILFLYKRFEFKYEEEFVPNINKLVEDAKLTNYKPKLDYYKDLSVPEYNYENKQTGGQNKYFNKYLKYKSKYLILKNNKNFY